MLSENKVVLHADKHIKYKGEVESIILSLAIPQANTHVFDLSFLPKYKLWKYNNNYQKYEKDSMNVKILKHKVERPALLDTMLVKKSQAFIRQFMENKGYFYAKVGYDIQYKGNKTAVVTYKIDAGKYYVIKNVNYQSSSSELLSVAQDNSKESALVKGDPYTAINCGLERDRLYKIIRNQGYYDFKSDNITFKIDTSDKEKIKSLLDDPFTQATNYAPKKELTTIDVNVNIGKSRDSTFGQKYTIGKVFVVINTFQDDVAEITESELDYVHFKYRTLPVNRKVIIRNIFVREGSVYNTSDNEITINRLNQLGIFQFVNVQYDKVAGIPGKLNCTITLNTSPKLDLVGVTDVSTSQDDYLLGTGVGLTLRNRNLFHGANLFSIRASYSTEFRNDASLNGVKQFYQSGKNFNLTGNLTFPKFIVPFNQNIFNKKNMPYTTLGSNYSFIRRIKNYTIINISGNFGYSWQETPQKNWHLNPIFLTVTQVPDKYLGDAFRIKLASNSYLAKTFSNSVIEGENVVFEYRSKLKNAFSNFTTMRIGFEEAGTLLKGINSLYKSVTNDSIQAIAHYTKADIDYRHYYNRRKSQWVNRMMLGVGIPIGSSTTLPYIKQFSGGGPFSNRGWRARTLGPGRAIDTTYQSGYAILDQTGDLKLEGNTEFRFNLLKLFSGAINLKGATFIDAGNIWLMNKNANVKGGEFDPKYFWQDMAISSGVGLRLDFSFLILRVDLGFPIKQPQIPEKNGFVIDKMKFSDGVWSLALGYPF